jgi:hypothetical protein
LYYSAGVKLRNMGIFALYSKTGFTPPFFGPKWDENSILIKRKILIISELWE